MSGRVVLVSEELFEQFVMVRQLSDGRYVCKACAFSSRSVTDATAHATAHSGKAVA